MPKELRLIEIIIDNKNEYYSKEITRYKILKSISVFLWGYTWYIWGYERTRDLVDHFLSCTIITTKMFTCIMSVCQWFRHTGCMYYLLPSFPPNPTQRTGYWSMYSGGSLALLFLIYSIISLHSSLWIPISRL